MDCQDTKTPLIKLNKDQSIGKVIYIVEGEKKEFNILKRIFTEIFDYTFVEVKRVKSTEKIKIIETYTSKNNPNSIIYVINSINSSINSIKSGEEYLNNIYIMLFEQYGLEPHKATIFYIFDRDRGSNSKEMIEELINKLHNSIDNGENANGLLLLSFPCVESFIISCYEHNCHSLEINSNNIKIYLDEKKYFQDMIVKEHIIKSCNEMIITITDLIGHNLNESDIDNFGVINSNLFNKQEEIYENKNNYCILSLLIISFIDLKLVSIE